jgi:hypothetical protein
MGAIMSRLFACVAGLLLAAMTSASALTFVRFSGGGYVTATSGVCSGPTLSTPAIFPGLFVVASYLPAGLGDNGAEGNVTYTALPQLVQPFAINLRSTGAFPTTNFATVNGTMVSVVAATHKAKAKLTTTPPNVTDATPSVKADLNLKDANGLPGCNVTIALGLRKNP